MLVLAHPFERTPVVIFLSDGECSVTDQTVQDFCRSAVRLGFVFLHSPISLYSDWTPSRKPLSLHAVSFGQDSQSTYLRRMAHIALDAQNSAPPDPLAPATATVLSSYSQALDTVRSIPYLSKPNHPIFDVIGATRRNVPWDSRITPKAQRLALTLKDLEIITFFLPIRPWF